MAFLAFSQLLANLSLDALASFRVDGLATHLCQASADVLAAMPELINAKKVEDWVGWGGPWVIFGLLFLCGLGLPLPEEIPVMAAGYFIGTGQMGWVLTCVLAWSGVIGGDCILYWFGRRYGLNITRVRLVGKHFTQERILRAEQLFERWGIWVVALGRLISGVRGVMCVAAGAIRYNFVKFIIVDGLAALISGGLFIFLGWWLGQQLGDFESAVEKVEPYVELFLVFAIFALIGFVFYLWVRHRRHKGVTDVAMEKVVELADKHAAMRAAHHDLKPIEPARE